MGAGVNPIMMPPNKAMMMGKYLCLSSDRTVIEGTK